MNLRLGLVTFACIAFAPQVFAQAGNDNPGGVTAEYHGSSTVAGHYDNYTGNAKREIDDCFVTGSIGAYPLKYTRTFNTRGSASWTHNYEWSMWVRPPDMDLGNGDGFYDGPVMGIQYPNGGHFDTITYDSPWDVGANGPHGASDLLLDCAKTAGCVAGAAYELRRADGGKVLFANSGGYKAYAIIDPYGQATNLTYDASGRLWKVTEPGGRYLQFNYQTYTYLERDGTWVSVSLLGSVQAYSAPGNLIETVSYGYQPVWITTGYVAAHWYNLTKAYYDDGAQATYTYEASNMNTGGNMGNQTYLNVLHTCDDPRYAGPMKYIEYDYVQVSEAPNFVGQGQIKAEKNVAGQVVSRTSFPTSYTDPNLFTRTETRGDGPSRTLGFYTWTDFKNQTWTETYWSTLSTLYGWAMTDPRGNTTTYEPELVLNALRKITYPATSDNGVTTREFTFSDPNNPYYHYGEKDENGNWTYFDRDPVYHRVTQIRYPDQSTEEFGYNPLGQVVTHKLRSGGTETFVYDTRGLKTASYPPATGSDPDPWNHPTLYAYYTAADGHPTWIDRLKSVRDPRGNYTAYEYNARGQVTKVQHQDYTYAQSAYNPDGTLAWTADENHPNASWNESERTRYTYDEYKRVRTVTNPMGEMTQNWYGLNPVTWGDELLHTTNSVKWTKSPMLKNVVNEYDANFRKTYQGVALGTADAAETRFDYDEVGNLTWTRDPRWNVTTFGYDQRNRKIWTDSPIASDRNTTGHTMNWKYDGIGNKTKETRADNAFRSWEYDIPNRITRSIDWRMSTAEPALTTTNWRSTTSRVETITDPKLAVYTFEFDELHRKTKETYPADVAGVNRYETWDYDAAGNLLHYRNRAGKTKTFAAYDNRNRPTSFSWNDNFTQGQSFVYDNVGNVKELHNAEADISFIYDGANRKTSETETIKSYGLNQTHTVSYEYDDDGNRYRLVYPVGLDYRHTYTNRSQLANIQLAWLGTPTVAYTYDPAGNRQRRTTYFGAYTDYHYNPLNQLDVQTSYFANGTARFDYGFDAAHRIKYEQRNSGAADGFSYDPRSELTGFNQNGTLNGNGTVSAAYNVSISYDFNGNRIEAYDGYHAPYATAPSNQYGSDWTGTLLYDDNENLKSRAGWTYTYDAQNRLVSIDGGNVHIHQHYDALNRIVARDTNGDITTNVWDNWNLIEERTSGDALRRLYFWGVNANEIVVSSGPAFGDLIYFQDGRGNVTHVTNPSNNVIERTTYFVSGQPTFFNGSGSWMPASTVDNRFLFEGALYIPQAEIYDMRNRFYHPNLGRFMQMDPIGFEAGDMNLFRYCGNDPVDRSDPTGLWDSWRNLTNFFNGNPSMNVILASWTQQTLMASLATTIPKGVNVHWDITNKIRLVPYVTKRDNRTVVKERGKPVAAGTRYDFGVTPEDAHNVTAHLSIDTQIATQVKTEKSRWETVRLEYQNVTALRDWATTGDGGYISRTAFRQREYSSGQEAADAVYAELAPSLATKRFWTKFEHDGPFGTHVPQ